MPSRRREQTQKKLVRAALDIVARDGFHVASVDAIAERAGYSVGALYSNFQGKDELFFAVFDAHVMWFEQQLAEVVAADDPARSFTEWMARLGRSPNQFLVFLEFWAYAVRRPATRRRLAERLAEMRRRVTEVVGDERVALTVLATARGLALEKLAEPEAVPDELLGELAAAAIGDEAPPTRDESARGTARPS